MPNPLPSNSRRILYGGIAVVVVVAGVLAWLRVRNSVPAGELASFLDSTVGKGRLHFTVTKVGARPSGTQQQVDVSASASPTQPLYSKIDAPDYLHQTFQVDPDSVSDARRILADTATRLDPKYRTAAPFPADPFESTLIRLSAPAGSSFAYHGVVEAHRDGGAWSFTLVSGAFDGDGPLGEARTAYGDTSYVAGDPGDEARLRVLATDLRAFADRVGKIRQEQEAARQAAADARRKAFLAQVAPGRVFRGMAQEAGRPAGTPLYLEIVALSEDSGVTALLRNEASWRNARAFQGTWSADDAFENPVLNLSSTADEAVRGAGPFLENTQAWSFSLHVDRQGSMSERNPYYQYRFQAVAADQVPLLKNRLDSEFDQAMGATEDGILYQGTALSRTSQTAEPILLRIVARSQSGDSIDARIESTTHSWKRTLKGSILANSRRSGAEPVRLRTGSDTAVDDAPPGSVLGDRSDLEIRLGFDGASLVGGDAHFTYRLAPVQETDLQQLGAARAERARQFLGILRDGIAYDGTLKEDQGFIAHARIEVTRVDRKTGAVAATLHSLTRPRAYREFIGTCDPQGGSVTLGATARGVYGTDDSFDAPFLKGPVATTLHLELTGTSITGRIEGNPHWVLDFPSGIFLSVPTETSEPGSPPANGAVFPTFPTAPGAYLLGHGNWLPMPGNLGHVVIETIHPKSDIQLPGNAIGAVDEALDLVVREIKDKKKLPYLEFDGKDPRPVAKEAAVIVLYVGPDPTGTPPLELALAETTKDGQRRLEVKEGPPAKVQFGEQRLAAYVRSAGPGYTLLTTTSVPEPGPYVLNAGAGYEFTEE